LSTIQPLSGTSQVNTAIRDAAAATDTDFDYLLAQARVESSLNPNARARTSSAAGLYQFTQSTWLETLKEHGAEHGLGWAADAISTGGGRARVNDPAMRSAIMNLRFDPNAASLMAGEFAGDNAAYIQNSIGRTPDNTELYLAHFLGAEGARRFIAAHDADPSQSAAALFPQAAGANPGVFYQGGAPRSLGEVREFFAAKLGANTSGIGSGSPGGGALPDGGMEWPPASYAARFAQAGQPIAPASPASPASPHRPSMAEVLASTLGPINAAGGSAPTHVARAYSQLARFGL